MIGQIVLSAEQVERLRPLFPKLRGWPRVDDRRLPGSSEVLSTALQEPLSPSGSRARDA